MNAIEARAARFLLYQQMISLIFFIFAAKMKNSSKIFDGANYNKSDFLCFSLRWKICRVFNDLFLRSIEQSGREEIIKSTEYLKDMFKDTFYIKKFLYSSGKSKLFTFLEVILHGFLLKWNFLFT